MLDAYIIDQLKRRERERRHREDVLHIPVPEPEQEPPERSRDVRTPKPRRVVIIPSEDDAA